MKQVLIKNIDAEKFFSRHDMLWDKKPRNWNEAPFIGSGLVGSLLYFNGKNRLTLTIGDTSVYDNRPQSVNEKDKMFLTPRLPLGRFIIGGVTRNCNLRLDLYRAVISGKCKTLSGSYSFRCFAPHGKRLIVIDIDNINEDFPIEWLPSEAVSPRQKYMLRVNKNKASASYQAPKNAYSYQHRDVCFCIQPLYTKGYSVIAYQIKHTDGGLRMIIATGQGTEEGIVTSQLSFEIENAFLGYDALREKHLQYWREFYSKSFLSLNDAAMEEFYWLQLYKLASAGCENGKIYDTCGPWLPEITAWPGTWWNLNVQLTYSPLLTSNHLELIRPLISELRDGFHDLCENVPSEYRYDSAAIGRSTTNSLHSPVSIPGDPNATQETGNLLWAVHTLWQDFQISQDEEMLKNTVYPLLKRSVSFYLHFLILDKKGRLHIPYTISPEYPEIGFDANYDLSLLRWGLESLLNICDRLELNESSYDEWQWVLHNLTEYPISDNDGFKIASDVPYAVSHRHYSHLLMIYPLKTLDLDQEENRILAHRSVEYWLSKSDALQGYSHTGAASMYAQLGFGDKAYEQLSSLWTGNFISANTMYSESGNPVLETPCAAATSILDMLLDSKEGKITIFPAIPKVWTDITFENFACEGGFLTSAVIRGGEFQWAFINNEKSREGICEIRIPLLVDKKVLLCFNGSEKTMIFPARGLRLKIPQGQAILVKAPDAYDICIAPVTYSEENCHVYGMNKDSMV